MPQDFDFWRNYIILLMPNLQALYYCKIHDMFFILKRYGRISAAGFQQGSSVASRCFKATAETCIYGA